MRQRTSDRVKELTLSVVILNWNGRAYLEECLDAVFAQEQPPERVILVDNDSADDSVAFVRERYPQVEIRENGGNLGFAAGNNVALRDLSTDAALLLNPDVVLSPGCLAAVGAVMATDPAIGIAGCKLWFPDGTIIQHAGGTITHPRAMPRHFGMFEPDEGQYDEMRDTDYVIGAAIAVRRELLEHIGLLDEGFFLFFEDADLCARAARAGFRVVYLPEATGTHVESATTAKGTFAYLHRFHSGRWRYLLKHFPADEITAVALAEETAWLEQLGALERRAAGLAYLATRRQLPEIWAAREREGAGAISAEARQDVDAGLAALQAAARLDPVDSAALNRLSAAAVLEERPFTSEAPLLGPIIAWFRTAWNNVASRWYVGHYVAQQNEFNRLAVEQIARYEAELAEMLALLEEQVVITAELQQRVQALQARISELRREVV